jgi:hypothetical protein
MRKVIDIYTNNNFIFPVKMAGMAWRLLRSAISMFSDL